MGRNNRKQISKDLRIKVLEKCNSKCAYCGCDVTLNEMQVDHVISHHKYITNINLGLKVPSFLKHLTEYDVDHFDNLMASCKSCNINKGSLSIEEFRIKIKSKIKRLNTNIRGVSSGSDYRLVKKFGLVIEIDKPVIFFFEQI